MIRRPIKAGALLLTLCGAAATASASDNDYPTSARVDYVFGCMAANGQTREAMARCSCSVDTLASILPYDHYVAAETILSMRQGVGQAANIFRNTPQYEDTIAELRRAQAEAEITCFK